MFRRGAGRGLIENDVRSKNDKGKEKMAQTKLSPLLLMPHTPGASESTADHSNPVEGMLLLMDEGRVDRK